MAYAASKLVLALMYARAWYHYLEYHSTTAAYTLVFTLAALVWVGITLFTPKSFALWAVASALSLLAPFYLPKIRSWAGKAPSPRRYDTKNSQEDFVTL